MSLQVSRLGLDQGKAGEAVTVYTNFFELSNLPGVLIHHYHVEFPGDHKILKSRDRCLQIIDRLQVQHPEIFTPRAAYDGKQNLFRTTPLQLSNNSVEFRVFMRPKANMNSKNPTQGGVLVKVTRVATIDPKYLVKVINRKEGHSSDSLMMITFLNVLVRMKAILSYPSNKNSFFTKEQRESLGGGLQIWRGLFQSVRPSIGRLIVNVDTTVAVMYRDGNLLDLVLEFMELRNTRDLMPSNIGGAQRKRLNEFLKNLLISTTIPAPGGNPRWRKINNVVMVGADDFKFSYDKAGGENISITEYYKSVYNYRMQYGRIICVSIRSDNSIVFPLEIMNVKSGQFYKKTLPSKMAAKALEFSSQKPDDRIRALDKSVELLGYADSDFLRQSGVAVNSQLLTATARILQPPPLLWSKNRPQEVPRGGAWNLVNKAFYAPSRIQAWSVIVFDPKIIATTNGYETVRNFVTGFVRICCALGMSFPRAPQIISGRPGGGSIGHHEDMEQAALAAIETFREDFGPNSSPRPTFILVVLPDAATDIYLSVKNWGDIVRGCPTQCVKSAKLFRTNNSYFSNLALKLNLKVGGVNSVPGSSVLQTALSSTPTMIMGADVSHNFGSDRPSIAGLVASMDEHFSQYGAITTVQSSSNEIIESIDVMVEHAVQNFFLFWSKRGGTPVVPHRIIFYRDGVSEGQFNEVVTKELGKIKTSFVNIWKTQNFPGKPPTLTFLIVGKKHHVKFFPKDNRCKDRSGNCPAGMVVDQDIVSPTDYDFYLQSHSGLLGTSRPSHYSVVLDENNLGADQLQALSYMLCYVYGRATRSVSIPAPVYYADIACSRGRIHSSLINDRSDIASVASGPTTTMAVSLEDHKKAFKPVAEFMRRKMYFM